MAIDLEEAPVITAVKAPDFSSFIGESRALTSVLEMIARLLDNDSTVLITGESGSGKELIAKALHFNSDRRKNTMITVNCGAIPEELLESELFGHEKGSFTGAIRARIGKFELADKGTIFLDEIGDMSPTLQIKLLRVLQEQEFERVGGARTIRVNVRVVAATNQNLEKAIAEKRFREDLFYRLNVIPVEAPALRERKEDISLLIGHFINKFNKTKNRSISGISPEALNLLRVYNWPGNIRELEHLVERLVVLKGDGVIKEADLPAKIRNLELKPDDQLSKDMLLVGDPKELDESNHNHLTVSDAPPKIRNGAPPHSLTPAKEMENVTGPGLSTTNPLNNPLQVGSPASHESSSSLITTLPPEGINLKAVVDRYETALIMSALERCGWVKNKAAILLGLNRTTLVEKLKKKKIYKEDTAA
ncbi:Response regulator of zinc sigma-54-dependent two-component system [hydrothermal vent metagenome]|uniref:Response regulator of zinc sigma-54-dependent two-component system n=1 Tax=hydrothermal vent metagenome TaxID=652676 RepID=A0A3B1C524_9ZZZZ